jgi:enediyne biosynthesis protein E4
MGTPRSPHAGRKRRRAALLGLGAALAAALLAGSLSCRRDAAPDAPIDPAANAGPQWFEDVTAAWGLDFVHDPGPTGTYFMPQSMGSGAACLDFDGDGLLDIYLLHFGGPDSKSVNRLFRQTAPGKFQDVTDGSGVGVAGHNHGVAVGDVNNDGKPDILLSQYGGIRLFLNLGGGKFADATADSGLANLSWGVSSAFLDYDRDGWLDLVVVNYLDHDPKIECRSPEGVLDFCGPNSFAGTSSKLFRNLGHKPNGDAPAAKFEDVSLASGVGKVRGPGLGVAVADLDGDGWQDFFVANDGQPNRLWVNQRNGTFAEEALSRGVAMTAMGKSYAGMGVAIGDANNDGLLDLYVTHLGSEMNNLWSQGPRGQFRDRTVDADLSKSKWRGTGFGTLMADFDHDGSVDIALVNGKVFRGGPATGTGLGFWETYAEKNQLFANDGSGKFRDISPDNPAFCDYWNVGRGLVCADFDNDGAPDLLVSAIGDRARLFRNVAPGRGNWLKVRAFDPAHNRDAYGAEVRVRAGGREFVRVVSPAESYLCSGSPLAHFGLGTATAVEWVRVTWPDGEKVQTEQFAVGAVNTPVVLKRGEGKSP